MDLSIPVNLYYWLIAALYILYIGALLGISITEDLKEKYAHKLSIFIQIFIAIILIVRFNPLVQYKPAQGDATLVFASAFFLLANVGITEWFLSQVKHELLIIK